MVEFRTFGDKDGWLARTRDESGAAKVLYI